MALLELHVALHHIYAITWLALIFIWIAAARITRIRCLVACNLSSWMLPDAIVHLLEGDVHDISGFEPAIHIRLVVILVLISSNILAFSFYAEKARIFGLMSRSGQLAVFNLLPLFLLCYRRSVLVWATKTCKPEILWVHYTFGWIVLTEVALHIILWVMSLSSAAGNMSLLSLMSD